MNIGTLEKALTLSNAQISNLSCGREGEKNSGLVGRPLSSCKEREQRRGEKTRGGTSLEPAEEKKEKRTSLVQSIGEEKKKKILSDHR